MSATVRSSSAPLLSLVVPMHDEAPGVDRLVRDCAHALEQVAPGGRHELVLVDDGSRDGTSAAIEAALAGQPQLPCVVVRLRRRGGKGAALAAGLREARGARIATLDADLQEDPLDLVRLVRTLEEQSLDVVCGWRRRRQDSLGKRLSSRLFNVAARWLGGHVVHDLNCGFRLFERQVGDEVSVSGDRFRWLPLVARWRGFRVGECEVSHRQRRHGRSHYGAERMVAALSDLFVMACLLRYDSRPGHLFLHAGGLSGLLGAGVLTYLTWLRLATGSIQHRYPLLALGVLLVVIGGQFVATGFLGEWLALRLTSQGGNVGGGGREVFRHGPEPASSQDASSLS